MRTRTILSTLAGAALVVAALPASAQANTTHDTTRDTAGNASAARGSVSYSVTISGGVSGRGFRRSGTVVLRSTVTRVTTNGVNPVDVCLKSGFPAGSPDVGAIWYGSNSACVRSTASLDMAYVRVNGNTVTVSPDSRISATFTNNFTANSSIASCIYHPTEGGATYTFHDNGTVSGRISMRGFGGYPCGNSTYTATLSGRRN
ncbi:hypothetical protein [Streptosporangium carneum]|uniref:Tat pathway signal sequence domain protein n=1 Tax=Streptosporangium carneum TaxID=47481 RepID=A0A9W6HZZ6_9ACTN|nr:hypothetical protein [Streptosporangium carneum]GLK08465.1 hypothetical protein GCM10017600_18700 [Streptosporangium carneum]